MSAVTRVKNHVTHTPTFDRARATTRSTVPLHRGDLERWRGYFRQGAGYVQGDSAIRHADGSFSFHGRCVRRSIPQSVGRSIAQAHMGHGIVGPRGTFAPASFSDQLPGTGLMKSSTWVVTESALQRLRALFYSTARVRVHRCAQQSKSVYCTPSQEMHRSDPTRHALDSAFERAGAPPRRKAESFIFACMHRWPIARSSACHIPYLEQLLVLSSSHERVQLSPPRTRGVCVRSSSVRWARARCLRSLSSPQSFLRPTAAST